MIKKNQIVKKSSITLGTLGILLATSIVPIAHSGNTFADSTKSLAQSALSQVNDQSSINTYNLTLHIGDSWTFNNNLDTGSNKDDTVIDFSIEPTSSTIGGMSTLLGTKFTFDVQDPTGILVNGKVIKAGTFQVQYHFGINLQKTAKATITVLPNTFSAKDSTMYTNEPWQPSDNFTGGLDLKRVTVTGTVDTYTPGVYPITYSYAGQSKTVNVTVKENKAEILTRNLTLHVGDAWSTYDNFAGYIDREGNPSTFGNNVHVSQDLITNVFHQFGTELENNAQVLQGGKVVKPGQFSITYTIYGSTISTDGTSSSSYPFRSATATITVLP
jgi:hypothetical protein